MRLKKLQLQGFKTFADKTEIEFAEGVTAIVGPNGSGKCVTGDTRVTLADGRDVPIRDLVDAALAASSVETLDDGWLTRDNPSCLQILSLNPNTLRLEPRPIAGFIKRSTPDHLLCIRTRAGREVKATPYHPFFVLQEGQVKTQTAEELAVGQRIALPRRLPTRPASDFPALPNPASLFAAEDNVYLPPSVGLDAWAGAGRARFGAWTAWRREAEISDIQLRSLLNHQGVNVATLTSLARAADLPLPFEGTLKSRGDGLLSLPPAMTPDLARFLGLLIAEGRNNAGGLIWFVNSDPAVNADYAQLTRRLFDLEVCPKNYKPNAVDSLIFSKTLGQILDQVFGFRTASVSADKRIPPQIWEASDAVQWAFLSGLFEGDAHLCVRQASATAKAQAYIEYTTASRCLAEQTISLLLRLGIFATLRPQWKYAANTREKRRRLYYSVMIYGAEQLKLASRRLEFVGEKQVRLQALRALATIGNPNHDVVPGVASLVKDCARQAGMRLKPVRRLYPKLAAYVDNRCEPTRQGIKESMAAIQRHGTTVLQARGRLEQLTRLADSDIYWDEVVSIEPVMPTDPWVYDLSVAGTHNFVANDIIVHNSNLGDAVLWVLGEQKASALRGTKAQDVIFAGSDGRKAMGMAEVSLTVDNSDGGLPMEFGEVVITRRAYRIGEGEYFINKVPCRLKDIYELFLDTGVGRESYALVNQGQIDAVLSVNAEDRRGLFEEAAGIKKYRVKKREALRKLEATEVNLQRVRDIQNEIVARVEPLRRQAERAEKHGALKDRLRAIESSLLIVDLRFADYEMTAARQAREEEQAVAEKQALRIAGAEARAMEIGSLLADAEARLEDCRLEHQSAAALAERAESGRALAAQRAEGLALSLRGLAAEREELADRRARLARQAAELEAELADARGEESLLRAQVAERSAAVLGLTEQITQLTRQAERQRAEGLALARQQAAREADLARAAARVTELDATLPGLREEAARSEASAREFGAEETAARDAMEAAAQAVAHAETAQAAALEQRDIARQAAQAASAKASAAAGALVSLSTRLRALQELEAAQEGYFAGVKAVFEAKKHGALHGDFTVVADSFETPAGYETAFETALAASLQDIITDTEDAAKAAIAYLHTNRAGRATFLPLNRMRPGRDTLDLGRARGLTGVHGAALDLISFHPKFRPALEVLLGRVFVCETLDDALRASTVAQGWNRVVTLTGELVLPSGALTGGRQSGRTANLLGRKVEIAAGQTEIGARQREGETAQAALAAAENTRDAAEAALSEALAARQSAQAAQADAGRRVERAALEARRAVEACSQSARRVEAAVANLALAREQADAAAAVLETGTVATDAAEGTQAAEAELLLTLTSERDHLQSELTSVRIALATVSEKTSSLHRALRNAQADTDSLASQEERKARQALAATEEWETLLAQTEAREIEVAQTRAARDAAQAALTTQSEARQALRHEAADAGASLRALSDTRAAALEAIHKNEVREARLGVQRETLAARLWEEYEISLEAALALDDDPELAEGMPQEVARLRRELRALGEVNPAAIEEYEEVRTRHEFLLTQAADLEEARAKLLAAIGEIDEGTRGVFLETFQAVGVAFETIWTRLFGGGKTELVLTCPNDVLETGVDILVQPPGKKRQPLALLSGGERALTAAALLFAFLTVKPSPFCVLDEVDAPLDGANVERFADLLREFGQKSQMIVITHNPTTMEAAPVWYGVTMTQPGISRVLGMQVPATG